MRKLSILGWIVAVSLGFTACGSLPESARYVEISQGAEGKFQVLLCTKEWLGVLTPEGYGGSARNVYYWATLQGPGPEYLNPLLHENSGAPAREHYGHIVVDRKRNQVLIDLMKVVSGVGEPERRESSPANGTYPIKKYSKEPFITPE